MLDPYYEDDFATLYHGDCRKSLPYIPADVVVTDPPFNVGKDYGSSSDDLPGDEYRQMMAKVAANCRRQAWVTPTNRLARAREATRTERRYQWSCAGGAKGPKRWGWFDQFDMVLVRGKPTRYVTNLWDDIRLKGEGYFFREHSFDHPGYTPYAIGARLVGLLAEPGHIVLDPFAGTGSTLVAAKASGNRCVGVELNEAYCEIAAKRLAQEVLDFGGVA